jgi:uncharacterized protein (DUF983 family)
MSSKPFWSDRRKLVPFVVILAVVSVFGPLFWATPVMALLPVWCHYILCIPFFVVPTVYFSNRIDEATDKYLGAK